MSDPGSGAPELQPERPGAGLPVLEDLASGGLEGRRLLVRVDMNVPITVEKRGERTVADDYRIRAALPTLRWLTERGALVTACTHLGRPPDGPDPRFDVSPVRARLEELLPGVKLLENLRFSAGEAENDEAFVGQLADGNDLYVNDAFGACHRRHASIVGVPAVLPSAAGRLVEREVVELSGILRSPAYPFVVVVGGAKVADKLGLISALAERADRLIIGGGMAFSFTEALGFSAGDSLVDRGRLAECRRILAEHANVTVPSDFVIEASGDVRTSGQEIPVGWRGADIGPATGEEYCELIAGAGSVLWNGPMGIFEDPRFASGTRAVALAVAACRGRTVVGGGDSAAAVNALGIAGQIDHVSTGGGATLGLLEHGDLPGLAALRESGRHFLGKGAVG
ncbi:MAG: phosphoglycerate kinase [Acidimicrobiales bacterium]